MMYQCLSTGLLALSLVSCVTYYQDKRVNVLTPGNSQELTVMGFSEKIDPYGKHPGWYNISADGRRNPIKVRFTKKDGKNCAELKTRSSMVSLFREVDIPVEQFPYLSWEWMIATPINSPASEKTLAGDDHPARIVVTFETTHGDQKEVELVWGNKISEQAFYMVDTAPRFVVRGGASGSWHREKVNLTEVYRKFWPQEEPYRITDIGIVSDSDNTSSQSLSYIANLKSQRR